MIVPLNLVGRRTLTAATLLAVVLSGATPVSAQQTFEGITGTLTNQGGYFWDNWYSQSWPTPSYPSGGPQNGVVSGTYAAINDFYGNPATISSNTPFTFGGAWFTATYQGAFFDPNLPFSEVFFSGNWSDQVAIFGYVGSVALYQAAFTVNSFTPTFFLANWTGVDRLVFMGRPLGGQPGSTITMDDIYFQRLRAIPDSDVVPEPASMALLATGLAGLAAARRTSKQQV